MKNVGWTTIKQVEKLIKAGIDATTADMYIPQEDNTPRVLEISLEAHHAYYPCWSFGRLIELIPDNYRASLDRNYQRFSLSNEFTLSRYETINSGRVVFHADNENPVDSIVEAIIWLLKNDHIRKEV